MKAMVLAAGFGTRLGDLTREIPKPMLDVEGRPMLEYILRHLQSHGFDDIIVNLHYRPEMIRDSFGDGRRLGVKLTYSHEPELLGTAGGLKNAERFFADADDFLVHYGDVVTDADFTAMLQFHRSRGALATLLTHSRNRSNSVICVDDRGKIERFLERPSDNERGGIASPWVHSGVAIARRELFDRIPPAVADLPRDVYVPLVNAREPLFAWPLNGYRCAVDSPERLARLRDAVRGGLLSPRTHYA